MTHVRQSFRVRLVQGFQAAGAASCIDVISKRRNRSVPFEAFWARILYVVLALGLMATDLMSGSVDISSIDGLLTLVVPYLPLIAMAMGPVVAAGAWFFNSVLFAVAGVEPVHLMATLLPTLIVVVVCTILLNRNFVLVFVAWVFIWILAIPLHSPQAGSPLTTVLIVFTAMAAMVGWALRLYRRRHENSTSRIQKLQEHNHQIRSDERLKLAHELHDIIAHDVTIIAMQTKRAEIVQTREKHLEIFQAIGSSATQALQDLNNLVRLLKDSEPEQGNQWVAEVGKQLEPRTDTGVSHGECGVQDAIEDVVCAMERAGFSTGLTVEGNLSKIPLRYHNALRRTLREIGTNAMKHGDPVEKVSLSICLVEGWLRISASNAVSSRPAMASSHTGMEAIRARCAAFGGELHAGITQGRWTTDVKISVGGTRQRNATTSSA